MNRGSLATAVVAGTAAAMFVTRYQGTLAVFGTLVLAGVLTNGLEQEEGVGRGFLWAAGGLAACYGIDKALAKR
jgi:hypothetical protein